MLGQRLVVLRDLVALGQIRIEIVLAGETRERIDRQCSASAALMASSTAWRLSTGSAPGSPRQTGQTLVFGGAPNSRTTAKDLGPGAKLNVHLKPDNRLVSGEDFFSNSRHGHARIVVRAAAVSMRC